MAEATEEKGAYQNLVKYNKKVINSWLERSGTHTASIQSIGSDVAMIRVCVSGKACIFIIYFDKKDFDKARSPRWVRIAPRAIDPFDKDEKVEI